MRFFLSWNCIPSALEFSRAQKEARPPPSHPRGVPGRDTARGRSFTSGGRLRSEKRLLSFRCVLICVWIVFQRSQNFRARRKSALLHLPASSGRRGGCCSRPPLTGRENPVQKTSCLCLRCVLICVRILFQKSYIFFACRKKRDPPPSHSLRNIVGDAGRGRPSRGGGNPYRKKVLLGIVLESSCFSRWDVIRLGIVFRKS